MIPDQLQIINNEDIEQIESLSNVTLQKRQKKAMIFENINEYKWKQSIPTFSANQIGFIFFQLLLTLDFAHSKGIMHRDIKPPNCLLSKAMKLVVIDWGQADYYVPGMKKNVLVGGRSYKAPELVYGGNHPDAIHDYACDIWSFGVMLGAVVFSDAKRNLFYADTREALITSFTDVLGTKDLKTYLDANPSIVRSPTVEKLLSEDLTPRRKLHSAYHGPDSKKWDPVVNDLLEKVLRYNPRERPTARECLKHDYFEDCRKMFEKKLSIDFEKDFDGAITSLREAFSRRVQGTPRYDEIRAIFDANKAEGTITGFDK